MTNQYISLEQDLALSPDHFHAITPSILYFGTPVVLISTLNENGSVNLAPMSSAWALGYTVVLGLGATGKTIDNLKRTKECVLNFPTDQLWQTVERLAPLTGKNPVPAAKAAQFRYEQEKFAAAGLTPHQSECVAPPRVAECPLQFEASVRDIRPFQQQETAFLVEAEVLRIHAHESIIEGERHINPEAWHPLIYNFRHYFGLGTELGKTFRADI
ncbi:flavin reductase family protein [Ktedonobacter robiniae]|nr:flavin reductase family protein [Ktedonobacter robiniae]